MKKTVLKEVRKINRKKLQHAKKSDILENKFENLEGPIETQHLLISTLLPPAVKAFIAECESEVEKLCGNRYRHGKTNHRWGSQNGSIVLGNQHVALEIPRVFQKAQFETNPRVKIEFCSNKSEQKGMDSRQ